MATTGWIDAESFDGHTNGPGHPERPERLEAIRDALGRVSYGSRLVRTQATPVDLDLVRRIHDPSYVAQVEATCKTGGFLDPDTGVGPASWPAALDAAGAMVQAVNEVLTGTWQRAFCSVRPPGHHATPDRAMGFCLFDNVAIGAQAALDHPDIEKVAIIDWDVHHGNGTQDIFWRRGDVLFASTHQFPMYPGTGAHDETGEGAGEGTTVNCPLPAGAGDPEILQAWRETIRPAVEAFAPDIILISAGFDADARDPLARMEVTAGGFETLSSEVIALADQLCGGRVVSILEGGYSLEALGEDVRIHVDTLTS